jgi:hypothetical protein
MATLGGAAAWPLISNIAESVFGTHTGLYGECWRSWPVEKIGRDAGGGSVPSTHCTSACSKMCFDSRRLLTHALTHPKIADADERPRTLRESVRAAVREFGLVPCTSAPERRLVQLMADERFKDLTPMQRWASEARLVWRATWVTSIHGQLRSLSSCISLCIPRVQGRGGSLSSREKRH